MKNSTEGKTAAFIKERQNKIDFYKARPFYGQPLAEKMYKALKKRYNILQVSACGAIVGIVHYKKDSVEMFANLRAMFPKSEVKQKMCIYTELITTYTIIKD